MDSMHSNLLITSCITSGLLIMLFSSCSFPKNTMICDSIIVHPSHRGDDHEARMLSWGLQLSSMNGFSLGVITSSVNKPLFTKHGFYMDGEAIVPNDGGVEGFDQIVVLWRWRRI